MSDLGGITQIATPPNPELDAATQNMAALLADARDTGKMDPSALQGLRAGVRDMVSLMLTDPRVSAEALEAAARLLTELDGWSAELSQTEPVVGGEMAGKSLGEIVEGYTGSLSTAWGKPTRWPPGGELAGMYRRVR